MKIHTGLEYVIRIILITLCKKSPLMWQFNMGAVNLNFGAGTALFLSYFLGSYLFGCTDPRVTDT